LNYRIATKEDIEFCEKHGISGGKFEIEGELLQETIAVELDGLVIGIGGWIKITDVCVWSWTELTPGATENIFGFFRKTRDWMNTTAEVNGIKRYQCWIDADNEKRIRFAEHLGFEKESLMKDFNGKGKDAFLYVKLMD